MFEVFKPEGGLWLIRNTVTGETLDRGPYIEKKTALRVVRQLEPQPIAEDAQAPAAPPEPIAEDGETWGDSPAAAVLPEVHAMNEETRQEVKGSRARHDWLEDALTWALDIIASAGGTVDHDKVRVSLGMTGGRKVLGVCFHEVASRDGAREIFVSPTLDDGQEIMHVLLHEACHACLPDGTKHGKKFADLAYACGLVGKPTATTAGDELKSLIAAWIAKRGAYPVGGLDPYKERKKQSTRLLKAECTKCGYTIRITKKWIDVAVPVCPNELGCEDFGLNLTCEVPETGE